MPLECCMFCLDTSDYMRNGDYLPTRLAAQQDSVISLAQYKLDDNLESSVGMLSMAGNRTRVLASPCRERLKLFGELRSLQPSGTCDYLSAVKIAQLCLRNRPNKNQRQRIILYVASPIYDDINDIKRIGRDLQKNGVAIDVVLFGTENFSNDTENKCKTLVDAVNKGENSHLVIVPVGQRVSDLVTSGPAGKNTLPRPVQTSSTATTSTTAQQSTADDDNDYSDLFAANDPDLAFAVKLSLEEAGLPVPQRILDIINGTSSSSNEPAPQQTLVPSTPAPVQQQQPAQPAQNDTMGDDDDDLDAELLLAMQMSLDPALAGGDDKKNDDDNKKTDNTTPSTNTNDKKKKDGDDDDTDADLLKDLEDALGGQ